MNPRAELRVFREPDGDVAALSGKTVAILGYGQVGRPLALNLRDATGATILIGEHNDEAAARARHDEFEVIAPARATAGADVVLLLVPDEVQPEFFGKHVVKHLRRGAALVFASGYNLAFGGISPPEGIDVLLFAPRMLGRCIRSMYLDGKGFYSYVSVERDATGRAWPLLLAIAKGAGSLRRGAIELSAAQEAELDLFGEQALGAWLGAALLAAFQVGCEAGLPPEGLLLEMYLSGEMAQTFQAMADDGFLKSTLLHGYTSAFGGMMRSLSIPRETLAASMRSVLEELRNGAFARAFAAEVADGYPCRALLEQMLDPQNPITQVEESLRKRLGAC